MITKSPRPITLLISTLFLIGGTGSESAEDGWKLYPTIRTRAKIPDYAPTFEKHFTVLDGTITGHCGLGGEFYTKNKCRPFEGAGPIWATNTAWPAELKDFEMTLEFRWYFKTKPVRRVGDDPDMNIGFRLRDDGRGYLITWGFLQQVRVYRIGKGGHIVGEGYQRRVKGNNIKLRIRAAGPIIKVKCWGAKEPEPAVWTVEAFDDWTGTAYESGAAAVGFTSRYFFDTTAFEYKNIAIKPLSKEDVSREVFFDPKTAPAKRRVPSKRFRLPKRMIALKGEAALAGFSPASNLAVEATDEGLVLESKDGKPAFLWWGKPSSAQAKYRAIRAKGSGSARPLLARRVTTEGKTVTGYFDPRWRENVAVVFVNNEQHTANLSRAEWKPDTWFDINYWRGHWCAWQLEESEKPETGMRFRASPVGFTHRKSKEVFGIGVIGKGSVTLQAVFTK